MPDPCIMLRVMGSGGDGPEGVDIDYVRFVR